MKNLLLSLTLFATLILLLISCKSKNDDDILTYDFDTAFENVQINNVESPDDPPFSIAEIDYGAFITHNSEETSEFYSSISDGIDNNIVEDVIDDVSNLSDNLFSDTTSSSAQELDSVSVTEIFNQDLSDEQIALANEIIDNADLYNLEDFLPTYVYSEDFNSDRKLTADFSASRNSFEPFLKNSNSAVDEECINQAQLAFDQSIAPLVASRDQALDEINSNYLERIENADQRQNSRLEYTETLRNSYWSQLSQVIESLLEASEYYNSIGLNSYSKNLKNLAYIYYIVGSLEISIWYKRSVDLIYSKTGKEKELIENRLKSLTKEINSSYSAEVSEANEIFKTLIADCHNQGQGS